MSAFTGLPSKQRDSIGQRLDELTTLLDWKEKVFQRWVDMKANDPKARIFKLLKVHRAKIAPLIKERDELAKVYECSSGNIDR